MTNPPSETFLDLSLLVLSSFASISRHNNDIDNGCIWLCFQSVDNRIMSSKSLVACIVPTTRTSLPKRIHVWELLNEYYAMKVSGFECCNQRTYLSCNGRLYLFHWKHSALIWNWEKWQLLLRKMLRSTHHITTVLNAVAFIWMVTLRISSTD